MKGLLILGVLCFSSLSLFGQVKALDKLEVLYDQGHYKMVFRKANNLLDQPDYDYSYKPEFYKSLALFQLADRGLWGQIHPKALQEARELFSNVLSTPEGIKVFNTHLNHVAQLKRDLVKKALNYKSEGKQAKYDEIQQILFGLFDRIPDLDVPGEINAPVVDAPEVKETVATSVEREEIVKIAKKQLGVPYKWAGVDSKGFDCSGFTSFVMKEFKVTLSRRAEDQYNSSVKVKQKNAQKGDLVFFNNGSGISHVGIVISAKGEPLTMIHASSSKGVIITNIEDSEYWLKRLYAIGTYVKGE
ncbi:C40 family peptidase [Fluviicola taffensis]|uniref:NLP/P60 protein n=1 Tax=Fluviicola taffensis (strain DSM 16823 / NCIMB 13979 / RW262) TaxID=755732 RepID=F2IEP8_FLUTR|nr:C40 family peptidase [Fluviicola taffensis]AEA45615.1 NLP/P60 protein [Fluviicola taffensis DSM 16823]